MKKLMAIVMAALLLVTVSSCGSNSKKNESKINVVSREDGSGTRGAFIELFGVEEKGEDGKKIDKTTERAEITNNTSVMMTTVAGDKTAIGYISLGSLNSTVKAVSIDGVAPSVEAINAGTYTVSRPFIIAVNGDLNPTAQDFVDFIMSSEGQAVIEKKGYIRFEDNGAYNGNKPSGTVTVAGSSSVTPVMESLKEAYEAINTGAKIEIQQSDSTTGMNSTIDGVCDIGMASRELKDSELVKGLSGIVIAKDGIAIIVNNDCAITNLTKAQVKGIYTGEITDWSEVK